MKLNFDNGTFAHELGSVYTKGYYPSFALVRADNKKECVLKSNPDKTQSSQRNIYILKKRQK